MRSKIGQRGFTLVEVMIVIAIIGILAAIAVPNFLSWLPNIRLKAAARDLSSNMHKMRGLAVKDNENRAIVFDSANGRYLLCTDQGPDGSWAATADNTILETISLAGYHSGIAFGSGNATKNAKTTPDSAPFDNISYTNDTVIFNAQGIGTAGYVYLQHQGNDTTYAVGSLTSGVIRILRWMGTTWE